MMAAAEPPKEFHDVSDHCAWTVLQPWIPGAPPTPEDIDESECQMVLKIHAILSRAMGASRMSEADLSAVLTRISKLVEALPSSTFHPLAAAFGTLWSLTSRIRVSCKDGDNMICVALHELGRLARARFGEAAIDTSALDSHALELMVDKTDNSPAVALSRAIFESAKWVHPNGLKRAMGDSLAVKMTLGKVCGEPPEYLAGPRCFYHKDRSRGGLLAREGKDHILFLDFEKRTVLMAHKSFCAVSRNSGNRARVDLRIEDL
jgi:hypothetical protein